MNTPSVSATKWWQGDLGLTSTHSCVYAQTIIDGKNFGVQSFLVPIRDLNSHRPLPGVEVGDIGPKFGFNSKDNGYMILDNVRVPRTALLSRYFEVSSDGATSVKGNPLVLYSIMMSTRIQVTKLMQICLAKAACIATRYSLVRT